MAMLCGLLLAWNGVVSSFTAVAALSATASDAHQQLATLDQQGLLHRIGPEKARQSNHIERQYRLHANEPSASPPRSGMSDITASVGRNATFECVFPDLKDFYPVWMHKDRHSVLATHNSVILKNGRISVRSHANTTYYLTIHDIREEDRGFYMCQVNTIPMRSHTAYLQVNVPPSFVDHNTSSDMDVVENSTSSLHCQANGQPAPEISWRREDGRPVVQPHHTASLASSTPASWIKGDYLHISNITRHHMGAYLCIASNGIQPTISKRIFLGVSFPPVIRVRRESIGAVIGSSVELECSLECYPCPDVFWQKDNQMPLIFNSDNKYHISIKENSTLYRFTVRLKIIDVHKSDLGKYTCMAKNNHGQAKGTIQLYEVAEKKLTKVHKPSYNSKPRTMTPHHWTTRRPVSRERLSLQVTEQSRPLSVTTELDMFDYETNYLIPEMNSNSNQHRNHSSSRWLTSYLHLAVLFLLTFALAPGWLAH